MRGRNTCEQEFDIVSDVLLTIYVPVATYSIVTLHLSPRMIFLCKSHSITNLMVNYLLPNLNVRSYSPTEPKLALLGDVTLCILTVSNWGVWSKDLKKHYLNICTSVQERCYDVLDYDLISCIFNWRDALPMTTVSGSSQSGSDIHLANWSKSSIKSSSPVAWHNETWFGR